MRKLLQTAVVLSALFQAEAIWAQGSSTTTLRASRMTSPAGIQLRPVVGASLFNLDGRSDDGGTVNFDPKAGLVSGLSLILPLSPKIQFETGLIYQQQNIETEGSNSGSVGSVNYTSQYKMTLETEYLMLPLGLRLNTSSGGRTNFYARGGLAQTYFLRGVMKSDSNFRVTEGGVLLQSESESQSDALSTADIRTLDTMAYLGLGTEIGLSSTTRLGLEANAHRGLFDITQGSSYKWQGFNLLASLAIEL